LNKELSGTNPDVVIDHTSPWGTHALAAWRQALVRLAHAVPGHGPIARRLVRHLNRPLRRGGQGCYDVAIWGLHLRLAALGNRSERRLLLAPQHFDPEEREFLARHLRPDAVFVDIGANVGAFTYWAHRCMQGRGRILAFEPDPEMHARLKFNLASNAMEQVDLEAVALSDHEGSASLYVDRQQRGRNTLETAMADDGDRLVQVVQLDTLWNRLRLHAIARIDALKIDIEGHELPVMRHFFAHAPREAWPKAVLAEVAHDTDDALDALLQARGYHAELRSDLNRGYTLRAPVEAPTAA
jgi:FkbM family methyltransferase